MDDWLAKTRAFTFSLLREFSKPPESLKSLPITLPIDWNAL